MLGVFESFFSNEFIWLNDKSSFLVLKAVLKTALILSTPELLWVMFGTSFYDDSNSLKDSTNITAEILEIKTNSKKDVERSDTPIDKKSNLKVLNNKFDPKPKSMYVEEDEFTLGKKIRFPQINGNSNKKLDDSLYSAKPKQSSTKLDVDEAVLELNKEEPFIDKSGVQIVNLFDYIPPEHILEVFNTETNQTLEFHLDRDVFIGNTDDCALKWSGIEEGKLFCKLIKKDDQIVIATCESSLVLNGKVFNGKTVLKKDSDIEMGVFRLRYISRTANSQAS
jgi:hypothetical protein